MPTLVVDITMRDYCDSNNIWTELVKILRSKIFDRDSQIKGPVSIIGPLANMGRFYRNSTIVSVRTKFVYTIT